MIEQRRTDEPTGKAAFLGQVSWWRVAAVVLASVGVLLGMTFLAFLGVHNLVFWVAVLFTGLTLVLAVGVYPWQKETAERVNVGMAIAGLPILISSTLIDEVTDTDGQPVQSVFIVLGGTAAILVIGLVVESLLAWLTTKQTANLPQADKAVGGNSDDEEIVEEAAADRFDGMGASVIQPTIAASSPQSSRDDRGGRVPPVLAGLLVGLAGAAVGATAANLAAIRRDAQDGGREP